MLLSPLQTDVSTNTTSLYDNLPIDKFLRPTHSFGIRDDIVLQIMNGMRAPQKKVPTVLLYDQEGSRLFDEITLLDEYYVTRTELSILKNKLGNLSAHLGSKVAVIELGSGSSVKAELLLSQIDAESYTCIDVSDAAVRSTSQGLHKVFKNLKIKILPADFTKLCALPQSRFAHSRLLFFPGSTIGNFEPERARQLLSHLRSLLSDGDAMLLGVDLKKDRKTLLSAYNDSKGVTAQFNLNILNHINRVARASFNPSRFNHKAIYNELEGRIEMHLISKVDQIIYIDGQMFKIAKDESIHTENSYKYSIEDFKKLACDSHFDVEQTWTDDNAHFSVHLLRVNRHGFH